MNHSILPYSKSASSKTGMPAGLGYMMVLIFYFLSWQMQAQVGLVLVIAQVN